MATRNADAVSDGSDIEVDRTGEEEHLEEKKWENELVEVHDHALHDEINEFVREIFAESDEEEDADFDGFQYVWVMETNRFEKRNTKAYTRQRGLRLRREQNLGNEPRAVDFFQLFWDDDVWARILEESNTYAKQQREANPPPPSFAKFKEFSDEEMKTYVGLCLMMGIIRLPKRTDYWRTKESCWLAHTNFGKAISRDRFNCIWRYVHLQNNESANPEGDKLFKIRKFLDTLLHNFKTVFIPG